MYSPRLRSGFSSASPEVIAGHIQALTLYDTLPPPDFQNTSIMSAVGGRATVMYERSQGRQVDLTHLIAMRRLVIIGLWRDAPLPIPLKVDGVSVPSTGWTVIRWIGPVEG